MQSWFLRRTFGSVTNLATRPRRKVGTLGHAWAMRARLGPSANGSASQRLQTPPPAMRDASLRETMSALSHPEQVVYPPTTQAGARLGYFVMEYRSAPIAFKHIQADKYILVRVVGRASRGGEAARKDTPSVRKGGIALAASRRLPLAPSANGMTSRRLAPGFRRAKAREWVDVWRRLAMWGHSDRRTRDGAGRRAV